LKNNTKIEDKRKTLSIFEELALGRPVSNFL